MMHDISTGLKNKYKETRLRTDNAVKNCVYCGRNNKNQEREIVIERDRERGRWGWGMNSK